MWALAGVDGNIRLLCVGHGSRQHKEHQIQVTKLIVLLVFPHHIHKFICASWYLNHCHTAQDQHKIRLLPTASNNQVRL